MSMCFSSPMKKRKSPFMILHKSQRITTYLFSFGILLCFSLSCKKEHRLIQENVIQNQISKTAIEGFQKRYAQTNLQEDFKQLILELETHPNLYGFISQKEWKALLKVQYANIQDSMTIHEFQSICAPIVARVGCGHTALYNLEFNKSTKQSLCYLPYKINLIDEKLYITKNLSLSHNLPLGAELLAINEKPINLILKTITDAIPADGYNNFYKARMIEQGFTYYYHTLFGLEEEYNIDYRVSETGKIRQLNFRLSNLSSIPKDSIRPPNDSLLQFSLKPNLETAIITIKSFSFYNAASTFHSFVDECFKQIEEKDIKHIIIDLRGNKGGDPYCSSYLLRAIADHPITYYKDDESYPELLKPMLPLGNKLLNQPIILIDGFGFSSTGQFCALVKQHDLGVFIGEETGSTYTCNAHQKGLSLTHTGLYLQIAQKTVEVLVDTENFAPNRGIAPDVEVKYELNTLLNNEDLTLQRAIQLIQD